MIPASRNVINFSTLCLHQNPCPNFCCHNLILSFLCTFYCDLYINMLFASILYITFILISISSLCLTFNSAHFISLLFPNMSLSHCNFMSHGLFSFLHLCCISSSSQLYVSLLTYFPFIPQTSCLTFSPTCHVPHLHSNLS